jgi:SAM-dependent methyltransferase
MTLPQQLQSFKRRRIDIPVDEHALVLDIGSGDKPHWRADVLVDHYVGAEHGAQRSGRAAATVDRPLFDSDAARMPFADGVFDYVICSHVLEHVIDPGAVIDEIVRVGRAGYIEVPEAASAKIVDFPSHLWWCTLDEGTLVFTAKQQPFFDADIERFLTDSGLREPVAKLLDRNLDHRVIEMRWSQHVPYRVSGTPAAEVIRHATAAHPPHRGMDALVNRTLTTVYRTPQRHKLRRQPVAFDDVVQPQWRTGGGEVLSNRIYRLDA